MQKDYSDGESSETLVSDATYQEEFSWSSVILPYVFCHCFYKERRDVLEGKVKNCRSMNVRTRKATYISILL